MVYSSFSSDFVSPLFPKMGEDVTLSIVFLERPDCVFLKYYTDYGLLYQEEMKEVGIFNGTYKYSATVPVSRDEFPFSFFFAYILDNKSYYYSKNGITRNTPSKKNRFSLIGSLSAPKWVASSTCYQIFPDRFNKGDSSCGAKEAMYTFDGGSVTTPEWGSIPKSYDESRCIDFYNGDLKGIEDKIDYLKDLGIDCVYLNPITASMTVHRFDSIDFFHIDEKLGGDQAFISLMDAMHKAGIKVVVDISINHTSCSSPWLEEARKDSQSVYGEFYFLNEDGSARCWDDVPTLVQLDFRSKVLRNRIYVDYDSALKKFLRPPFEQDGWRLDVAPELGRNGEVQLCQEVWREVRDNLKKVNPECYLVGEEWDDAAPFTSGDMWDATMNYFGSGRPIRSWLGERDRFLSSGWGHSPEKEDEWSAYDLVEALKEGINAVPDQMAYFQMNLFDSHDTPRLHNNLEIYNKDRYFGGLILLYLLPGMPNIYYGDEVKIDGTMGSVEGSRYSMNWNPDSWDLETLEIHKKLGKLRKISWLGYSSFSVEALDDDALVIKRFVDGHSLLGIINKAKEKRCLSIDLFALPKKECKNLLSDESVKIVEGKLLVTVGENQSTIVEL